MPLPAAPLYPYAPYQLEYEHFDPNNIPSTSRTRSTDKLRQKKEKVPRPPNAWILFRSEMTRIVPPAPARGRSTTSQALASGAISKMWAQLTPAVRAEYERRAAAKKYEHKMQYPDYRFEPMPKETKIRLIEERKREKEENKKWQREEKKRKSREQELMVEMHLARTRGARLAARPYPPPTVQAAPAPQNVEYAPINLNNSSASSSYPYVYQQPAYLYPYPYAPAQYMADPAVHPALG